MKQLSLLACLLFVACATAPGGKIIAPDVEMYQLIGPADQGYPRGSIEVQFGLRIANRSGETITLRQVDMIPVGSGGPYAVVRRTYHFNQSIAPSEARDVTFWARAEADGDAMAVDANAPVSLRAVAHFQSTVGPSRKILMKTFTQQSSGPRNVQ